MDYEQVATEDELAAARNVDRAQEEWFFDSTPENWKALQDAYAELYRIQDAQNGD